MATVVLLGTFDTKGDEYDFLRDRVERAGCAVVMVNAGIMGDPAYPVDVDRRAVAMAGGADLDDLVSAGDRGRAVTTMAAGAAATVLRLHAEGRLDGVLGVGGSGGSSIISAALRALPVGMPKMLVSTVGSGDTRPYVGESDIAMVYSVVDIAGINAISEPILGNAATAIAAMALAQADRVPVADQRPMVGATMYGTTTPCVDRARRRLEDVGYEVVVFHATGPGGRSMEALMRSGHITAALDVTTTELVDHLYGGTFSAGPDRLETAGDLGLPQVVSVGAADQITFTPHQAVPESMRGRLSYRHNPAITLVRSTPDECEQYAHLLAGKLNRATGPVTLFVPLRGTSSYAVEGGVFHDPAADQALAATVRAEVDQTVVELVELDTDINDPVFGEAMARRLDEHHRAWRAAR